MPDDEKKVSSDLDDAIDGASKLARGLAGKVLGSRVAGEEEEGTVVTEEFDQTLEEAGGFLGGLLSAAGEAMKEHSKAPDRAVQATVDKVKEGHEAKAEEGWSPLVQGASTFAEGFGKMGTELLDSLVAKDIRPAAEE